MVFHHQHVGLVYTDILWSLVLFNCLWHHYNYYYPLSNRKI